MAGPISVVLQMKLINDLGHISPNVMQISRQWQWLLSYFKAIQMAHVVIGHNNALPFFSSSFGKCRDQLGQCQEKYPQQENTCKHM